MKKSWITACFATAALIASGTISIRAQKQSDAQPAHSEKHAAQPAPSKEGTPQHAACPMMQGDKSDAAGAAHGHDANLAAAGERAMGFSQTATTHHFILTRDGGIIQVGVNDPKDAENLSNIRQHLAHIARMFAEGNFSTPMFVHDRVPPGVPVMERLKTDIKYTFEETERGARVRITTANADALAAVHEFLRFQIKDHQTGDTPEQSQER
jgi:hypothetical protein